MASEHSSSSARKGALPNGLRCRHLSTLQSACLLLTASLFFGCGGGGTSISDAELVKNSDYQQRKDKEHATIEQIKKAGGEAVQKTYPLGEAWAIKLVGATINEGMLDHLKTLGRVAELDLSRSSITDAQMPQLAEAAGVCFRLNLSKTGITDAGLAALADMPLLMDLTLTGTKVSKAAAADFKTKRLANPKVNNLAKKNARVTL